MTYLGMQIMIEGLALAAFGFMHAMTTDPLLKQLLRYVMADEARHVAFGVLSLQEYYAEPVRPPSSGSARSSPSRRPCACATGSSSRRSGTGWASTRRRSCPLVAVGPRPHRVPGDALLQDRPELRKLGLLDAADGWLRTKFTELGVIEFESAVGHHRGVRRHGRRAADPARAGLTTGTGLTRLPGGGTDGAAGAAARQPHGGGRRCCW